MSRYIACPSRFSESIHRSATERIPPHRSGDEVRVCEGRYRGGHRRAQTAASRAEILTPELEQKILDTTLKTRPGDGGTHWSVRLLAGQLRLSHTMVHRVWKRHDVQPHRVERFKLSKDPHFEEKVRDVVGLYLNPPDRALVLCVDEKSQIQALDRTAPILPLRPGLPERQTHDYKRHGTTTLFAAFNILNGKVIGTCQDRHRSREFIRFLNHLEKQLPPEQASASGYGQLLRPQERRGPTLAQAEEAAKVPLPLHPHQQFVAESGRTFLRPHHRTNDSPRNLPQRRRTRTSHLSVARQMERRAHSVCLEGFCRRDPRQRSDVVKNYLIQESQRDLMSTDCEPFQIEFAWQRHYRKPTTSATKRIFETRRLI